MRRSLLAVSVVVLAAGAGVSLAAGSSVSGSGGWAVRDLGTLAGRESWASGINERGQIVGYRTTEASVDADGKTILLAFLWQNGNMRELGTLGGPRSLAVEVNERGQIVGWATTKNGEIHAVLWTKTG